MGDLEGRLRAEVTRRRQEYSPSADFGDRIDARVRQRRRQRRLAAGVLGAAAAAIVVVLGVIVTGPPDDDSVRVGDDREAPTTTRSPSSTTTTMAETTSTTTAPTGAPIGPETPLTRSGIGPIRAGMTLREAQTASGATITPNPTAGPGSTCSTAEIADLDVWFLVSLSGEAAEDPMDGVIGSVQGGRRTIEGLAVGDPVADVNETYGAPTRTLDYPYLPGGEVLVFESGGYAYSVTTDGATVTELESGDPDSVANLEGCE